MSNPSSIGQRKVDLPARQRSSRGTGGTLAKTACVICLLSCASSNAQVSSSRSQQVQPPVTLHEIGRVSSWSRIGSPPRRENSADRGKHWPAELAAFNQAFDIIKQTWTGQAIERPEDLRFEVRQYEDLVRTLTEAGGYGNLILSDSLRRLSGALVGRYLVSHPAEYATVADILNNNRISLIDCPATTDMIMEELKLAPPAGKWHFAEDRKELDLIYRTDGTNLRDVQGMSLIQGAAPSKLIARRDVSGLLNRLVADEWFERFLLPSFIEFLSRGGSPLDPPSFDRVMVDRKNSLRFAPTGDTIGSSNINALINGFRKWDGKALPFSVLVEN